MVRRQLKKNPEGCVTCGKTRDTRWHPFDPKFEAFRKVQNTTRNRMCHLCFVRLDPSRPSVKRSNIPKAGNGLFADRDYEWNELVAVYSGDVYPEFNAPRDSVYLIGKHKVEIDGRTHFGNDYGRYINCPGPKQKANVRIGNFMPRKDKLGTAADLGYKVAIRAIAKPVGVARGRKIAIYAGEELLITYGSGYHNSIARRRAKEP